MFIYEITFCFPTGSRNKIPILWVGCLGRLNVKGWRYCTRGCKEIHYKRGVEIEIIGVKAPKRGVEKEFVGQCWPYNDQVFPPSHKLRVECFFAM